MNHATDLATMKVCFNADEEELLDKRRTEPPQTGVTWRLALSSLPETCDTHLSKHLAWLNEIASCLPEGDLMAETQADTSETPVCLVLPHHANDQESSEDKQKKAALCTWFDGKPVPADVQYFVKDVHERCKVVASWWLTCHSNQSEQVRQCIVSDCPFTEHVLSSKLRVFTEKVQQNTCTAARYHERMASDIPSMLQDELHLLSTGATSTDQTSAQVAGLTAHAKAVNRLR